MTSCRHRLPVLVWVMSFAFPLFAQETDGNPQTPAELHEFSVWVGTPAQPTLNSSRMYKNSMPGFVGTSRRTFEKEEKASTFPFSPVAVAQFFGEPIDDIDVDLQIKKGTVLSHWPAGTSRGGRLRWFKSNLVAAAPADIPMTFLPPSHWFEKLRSNPSALYLKNQNQVERFIAYDLETALTVPVRIKGGPDEYILQNLTGHVLADVAVIAPSEKGYRVGWLDLLPTAVPEKEADKDKETKAEEKSDTEKANELFDDAEKGKTEEKVPPLPKEGDVNIQARLDQQLNRPVNVAAMQTPRSEVLGSIASQAQVRYDVDDRTLAAEKIDLGQPMDMEAPNIAARDALAEVLGSLGLSYRVTEEGKLFITTTARLADDANQKGKVVEGAEVKLVMSQPLPADDPSYKEFTRDSLTLRLTEMGLRKEMIDLLLGEYGDKLFQPEELIVLVRLSRDAIDEASVLDVFPPPKKIVRAGLLVVHGVDPRLQDRIRELVKKLGDDSYKTRESAERLLAEMGPVAVPVLEEAIRDKDVETVFRAERLLKQVNPTTR